MKTRTRYTAGTALGGAAIQSLHAQITFDEFDGLDATEKAAIEGALNRCCDLAAQIESKLRNKRPEHFVDKLSLADFYASLEHVPMSSDRKANGQSRIRLVPWG
jgi:hypothetical protein